MSGDGEHYLTSEGQCGSLVLFAKVMLMEPGTRDARTISATDHFGQCLMPSVPASIHCKGSSTILGMTVMDI